MLGGPFNDPLAAGCENKKIIQTGGGAAGVAPLELWRRLRRRQGPRPAATPSLPPPRADEIDVSKKGNSNAALAESAKFVSAFVVTLSLENDQGI